MLKKILYKTLIIPLFFIFPFNQANSNDFVQNENISIEKTMKKKSLYFNEITDLLIQNNFELKSLDQMIKAASFNYTSALGKKYPSIDLSATGLPQYLYGENYNSNNSVAGTQTQPNSNWQVAEHPSLSFVLLSSQLSGPLITPSPQ